MQNILNNSALFIIKYMVHSLVLAFFLFREANFNIPKQNSSIKDCLDEKIYSEPML